MPTDDLRRLVDLDRSAVESSVRAVEGWRPDATDPDTPCASWRVSDLVAHMTVQQRGFARAARGERTRLADWTPRPHADPLAAYREASEAVVHAFADAARRPDSPVHLPDIAEDDFSLTTALRFHLVDNVVHAWDVARALGAAPDLDEAAVRAAVPVARQVPDGETREGDRASFAHRLSVPDDASALEETLLLLGRDPRWSPPAG